MPKHASFKLDVCTEVIKPTSDSSMSGGPSFIDAAFVPGLIRREAV